ncbi:hypothetical protein G9A89_002959 [Geosiphon pyriformis]|nr:hypothetical protein G9A89_002959 [Geosiphon pyriformis]
MEQLSPDSPVTKNLHKRSQVVLSSTSDLSSQNFAKIRPSPSFIKLFFVQLSIMVKRNLILQFRYRKSTISQAFIGPFLILSLLCILQKADINKDRDNLHPGSYPLLGVLPCQGHKNDNHCINVLYTPETEENKKIMQIFSANNEKRTNKPIPMEDIKLDINYKPDKNFGIIAVPDASFIYNYTLYNPNITLFGIEFTTVSGPPTNYRYQIWYNSSHSDITLHEAKQLLSFQRGIDEAIITVATNSTPGNSDSPALNVRLKNPPFIPRGKLGDGIVTLFGSTFFFSVEMIIFIAVLNTIVTEKEQKLTASLVIMGLKKEVYWLAYFISTAWLITICSLITCTLGLAFNFFVFKNTDFLILLITFILFGLAMVTLAFFISTFCRSARAAVLIGILFLVIGLLFQSFVFSISYIGYIWWDTHTSKVGWIILMFFPFFNFGKIYLDMSQLTARNFDFLMNKVVNGPGFHWNDLYRPIPSHYLPSYSFANRKPDVPNPIQSWYFLLMNIGFYLLLTWYFDKIIPDEFGTSYSTWFFLSPKFWGLKFSKGYTLESWLARYQKANVETHLDEDVDIGKERSLTFDPNHDVVLRIGNLRKIFRKSLLSHSKLDKVAVNDLCLTLKESECLALLGQNGAGKSTSINILSGQIPPTSGDALLYGLSVQEDMDKIRKIIGVCPQHDILFDVLTAREHIELYATIKMIPAKEIKNLIEKRLAAVHLLQVADKPVSTYSGGMKRRLSMIISTIGDPQIIFMDEPTTGMDPVNRRHVWKFVENFKRGRVIVLTTHSMEEADILGDRIGVIAHGQLRALGTSIHLKNRFNTGYRVLLVTNPQNSPLIKNLIKNLIPSAVLKDDSWGALIYELSIAVLPSLIKWLEDNEDISSSQSGKSLITSWGVSQKSLEEAFLKIIQETNRNNPPAI